MPRAVTQAPSSTPQAALTSPVLLEARRVIDWEQVSAVDKLTLTRTAIRHKYIRAKPACMAHAPGLTSGLLAAVRLTVDA
ncbi:hypothetical protein QJQ45_027877 [Haematococcus lacustris]|nr:hypothetical protein QJQ45_027877 [Haematococcus lacustris]